MPGSSEVTTPDVPAGRLVIVSAVTSLAAVLSAVYGLKRIAQTGADPLSIAAIVIGVLLAVLFIRRQGYHDDPMVDLGLFRRTAFSVALASNTLSFFVLYGSQLWIAQYLQVVLGLSPLRAGIYTIPSVLGYLAGATIAPAAARRLSPHRAIGAGLVIVCTGFALMAGVAGGHGLALVIAGSVVFSVGLAPVYALTTEIIVASVPPERAGSASAVAETGSELGGALGIAVLGSLGVAIYRHQMGHAHLPPQAAGEAGGTIGSAATPRPALLAICTSRSRNLAVGMPEIRRDAGDEVAELAAAVAAGRPAPGVLAALGALPGEVKVLDDDRPGAVLPGGGGQDRDRARSRPSRVAAGSPASWTGTVNGVPSTFPSGRSTATARCPAFTSTATTGCSRSSSMVTGGAVAVFHDASSTSGPTLRRG
jgi:hypothetical protein